MDSVIALQAGLDFQGSFFWFQAAKLRMAHTKVAKIQWESTSTVEGFDDVVVHYDPGTLAGANLIRKDGYQVKYHVDHKRQFTCAALIDPSFIGTKDATILNRLYNAYLKDNNVSSHTRLWMVNSWGLDASDEIGKLLDNEGAFRIGVLFDGKADTTKYGRIRKSWRDHLGITDDDILKKVLLPLRIDHSYDSQSKLNEKLSLSLLAAKLQPLEGDKHINPYSDLIKKLHAAGITEFDVSKFSEICTREGLYLPDGEAQVEDVHRIGVRSFKSGAETLHLEVVDILCLLNSFTGRFLNEGNNWDQIHALLVPFAEKATATKKIIELHLDTHLSVAFTLGYYLTPKTGAVVRVVQKTPAGKMTWSPDPAQLSSPATNNWVGECTTLNPSGNDIVVSISATHDIKAVIENFVMDNLQEVAAVLSYSLPTPSNSAFRDGSHVVASIYELVGLIRKEQAKIKGVGKVHIFMAAPNAFSFYLGQHAHPLGSLTLYEYDFHRLRDGSYHPAITLPM
ncbi:MAG: SAVED domain-containing protein [Candidatus Pseudobacter hemicellulosilyticus]|uniref:SAVED domain-containing protein n=1 Tax=Candidatus Pseudobacter hemicellulosilyticus TaxID=3121375 RepID=A0AAJ6BFS1_9BACT|nr:MAG: SAVED domain-containing protein [Pseudobacter sp.]